MMQLYYMPGACSLADHIVLEWVGAEYGLVEMNHESIKAPEYLSLNPGGSVPVLKHGGFVLTQNVAILHYLAELYPFAHLLGGHAPRARAEVMRWLAFLNSDVHKAFQPLFVYNRLIEEDPWAAGLVTVARRKIRGYLERLDQQLEGSDWITDARSVADPYLFVILRWSAAMEIDLNGLRNLAAFAKRMYAEVGVRAALLSEEGIEYADNALGFC
jgi:glutathione S-transferase